MSEKNLTIIQDPPIIDRALLRDKTYVTVAMSSNNKRLALTFTPNNLEARSDVDTINALKVEGTTTVLYTRLKQVLTEIAGLSGKPVDYALLTYNSSMQHWALSTEKGRKIFDWDRVVWEEDERLLRCEKSFAPR